MNLKEAFHYQNYLSGLFNDAIGWLERCSNLLKIEENHHMELVNPEEEPETVNVTPDRDWNVDWATVIRFMKTITNEKSDLTNSIIDAKKNLAVSLDFLTAKNILNRDMIQALSSVNNIKASKSKEMRVGYKINAAGDPVSYNYPVEIVKTLDFDEAAIKAELKRIKRSALEISTEIDQIMVNTQVDFYPLFEVDTPAKDVIAEFKINNE